MGVRSCLFAILLTLAASSAFMNETEAAERVIIVPSGADTRALMRENPVDTVSAVIIVENGESPAIRVFNGSRGRTIPLWLSRITAQTLDNLGLPWRFDTILLQTFRLGWKRGNPELARWLDAGYPAVLISRPQDSPDFMPNLVSAIIKIDQKERDLHYLVFPLFGRTFHLGERNLVILTISGLALILLFVFIFSFLLGSASERHFRDFLRVWWLPFVFFFANAAGLYAGQTILSWLFTLRFGNGQSWELIPRIAFAGKLIISWFIITGFLSLNQLFHLPDNSFIYGYIGSLVCLVNVLAFSALDISLSPLFLAVYCISFIFYHLHSVPMKALGLLALVLPFLPYFFHLINSGTAALDPLYLGKGLWNLRIALFALPLQFFFTRLFLSTGATGTKRPFYLPVSLVSFFAGAAFFMAYILFVPLWSKEKPLPVSLNHLISDTDISLTADSLITLKDIKTWIDPSLAEAPNIPETSEALLPIGMETTRFLNRQKVILTIAPAVPFSGATLTITAREGIAVHAADHPFETSPDGLSATFTLNEDTVYPKTISFSSDSQTALFIQCVAKSSSNPFGLTIRDPAVKTLYNLEIRRTLPVPTSESQDSPP